MGEEPDSKLRQDKQEILGFIEEGNFGRALEKMVRTFQDAIYRRCFNQLGRNHELAEDVMQEVFLAALRALPKFRHERGEESIVPWLYAIARYKILDARVELIQKGEIEVGTDSPGENVPPQGTDPPPLSRAELEEALGKLDPEDQEILVWHAYRFRAGEIAQFLEETISEAGVRSRIRRALKKLRKVLDHG